MLELTLNSGIDISLDLYVVERTYASLLMGSPNEKLNLMLLETRENTARQICNTSGESTTLLLNFYTGNAKKDLPEYRITGSFVCNDPARDPKKMGSDLTVIWYQDVTHPIMTPENEAEAKKMDWKKLARDFDW